MERPGKTCRFDRHAGGDGWARLCTSRLYSRTLRPRSRQALQTLRKAAQLSRDRSLCLATRVRAPAPRQRFKFRVSRFKFGPSSPQWRNASSVPQETTGSLDSARALYSRAARDDMNVSGLRVSAVGLALHRIAALTAAFCGISVSASRLLPPFRATGPSFSSTSASCGDSPEHAFTNKEEKCPKPTSCSFAA